jgi:hypothetical protein
MKFPASRYAHSEGLELIYGGECPIEEKIGAFVKTMSFSHLAEWVAKIKDLIDVSDTHGADR